MIHFRGDQGELGPKAPRPSGGRRSPGALALVGVLAGGFLLALPRAASAQQGKTPAPPREPTLIERVTDLEAVTNSEAPVAEGRISKVSTNAGDNAWLLTSSALVLMMTGPGLALFYGGLVRKKNVLSTMMHSMFLMALMSILWFLFGYSVAFGEGSAFFGSPTQYLFLRGVGSAPNPDYAPTIPHQTYMLFQLMFAIITPALISGAYAERIKFGSMVVFTTLWAVVVYFPLAHMVWGKGGLFNWSSDGRIPALDFAGGTVVHISSGVSALVCALVLGKRLGYPGEPMPPHNVVLSMTGAGMLWVGWFGFNAGSALMSGGGLATSAFAATHFAAAAATFGWVGLEWMLKGKPSALGAASGMVAGLVAVTPASGFVTIPSAVVIGLLAGGICYLSASKLKAALGYDDSLDAFGVHGVGGTLGALLTGCFASAEVNPAIGKTWKPGGTPVSLEGGFSQFLHQASAVALTWILAAVATYLILKVIDLAMGLRAPTADETQGIDLACHGESAYN